MTNSWRGESPGVVRDGEEREAVERDLLEAGVRVEDAVEQQMAAFVGAKPDRGARQELAEG